MPVDHFYISLCFFCYPHMFFYVSVITANVVCLDRSLTCACPIQSLLRSLDVQAYAQNQIPHNSAIISECSFLAFPFFYPSDSPFCLCILLLDSHILWDSLFLFHSLCTLLNIYQLIFIFSTLLF